MFSRLQGLSNNGTDFFNIDGIDITIQNVRSKFSKKNITKKFKRYAIKGNNLKISDSLVQFANYAVSKSEEISPGIFYHSSYYFIQNQSDVITAITFGKSKRVDNSFEKEFVNLYINKQIPKPLQTSFETDSINFAGRKIALGKICRWMGVNNVQCPYSGQMNWSVHKTLEDASQT